MNLNISVPEKMLFDLLRASLNGQSANEDVFRGVSGDDWKRCRALAVKHGVMALAFDGVMTLPQTLQPPRQMKIAWGLAVKEYEKRYAYYCHTVQELSEYYAEHGIATVQLKGVGLSTYYPVPSHREGGDIDIFTYSADKSKLSDKEANTLADDLIEEQGTEVEGRKGKHSIFYYHGIPIENHKHFVNLGQFAVCGKVEKILHQKLNPVQMKLLGGECDVMIPSPEFNTLFLIYHILQHFAAGFSLHHLCDWACLLNNYGLSIPAGINDGKFITVFSIITSLSNRLLGTDVQVDAPGEMVERAFEEMMHPKYVVDVPDINKFKIILFKTKRLLYRRKLYKYFMSESILRGFYTSIIFRIRHPEFIFKTR